MKGVSLENQAKILNDIFGKDIEDTHYGGLMIVKVKIFSQLVLMLGKPLFLKALLHGLEAEFQQSFQACWHQCEKKLVWVSHHALSTIIEVNQ